MKKIIVLLLVGIILIKNGYSLYKKIQNNPSDTTPSSASQTSPVKSNNINIQNFNFTPATLTIKKGMTVTWTNNDSAPHTIKSSTFKSDPLNNGQSFSFTLDNIGTFDYLCSIHPSMLGKIIVE